MIARTKSIKLTLELLNNLLVGENDNEVIDTIPEALEYLNDIMKHGGATAKVENISIDELNEICV